MVGESGLVEGLKDKNSCFREAIFNFRFEWESWEDTACGQWQARARGVSRVEAQASLTATRVDREPPVQVPPEVRKQSAFTRQPFVSVFS